MSNHGWPEESDSDVIRSLIRERDALEADRDQISLTLAVAKADRDKWFNRARELEAALRTLWQNQDHDTWAPDFVAEVRALLKGSTPETKGESNG